MRARRFPPRSPYVVAAVDRNHGGRLAVARRLVTIAADAGADAVKFVVPAAGAADPRLPPAAWRALRREAAGRLQFVLAPHDRQALAMARRLKPDVYQVDPGIVSDLDLVGRIARERRPVLVVTAGVDIRGDRKRLYARSEAVESCWSTQWPLMCSRQAVHGLATFPGSRIGSASPSGTLAGNLAPDGRSLRWRWVPS